MLDNYQDPNFFERLIGAFRGSKQSKKQFYNTRVPYMMNSGKVYINTDVPYLIYNSIPQISLTVDKISAMFSNGVFKYQKIGSDKFLDMPKELGVLLEKPNIFQGQNAFMKQYILQYLIYGNQYIRKNQASTLSKVPTSLLNVSPTYLKPILTGKMFDQVNMDGVISKYEYTENGSIKSFETNEILWSKVADLDNPVIGCSPLLSLQFPISNTELAYKYLNCISGEKGAIGILSNQSKDSMGSIPMDESEKKEIESSYRSGNGIEDGQKKIHITNGTVSWAPMSYPTGQLLLLEQIDANFLTILAKYGVNSNIFVNSTYENLRHGLMSTHNDTIQPHADQFCQHLSEFIGIDKGYKLVLDYSHLPYLQTDKKNEAETIKVISDSLTELVNAGIISNESAQIIMANNLNTTVEDLQFKGNPLTKKLTTLSPLVANNVLNKFTDNEVRSLVDLPKIEGGDVINTPVAF
jgi:phage portal protein BeeE